MRVGEGLQSVYSCMSVMAIVGVKFKGGDTNTRGVQPVHQLLLPLSQGLWCASGGGATIRVQLHVSNGNIVGVQFKGGDTNTRGVRPVHQLLLPLSQGLWCGSGGGATIRVQLHVSDGNIVGVKFKGGDANTTGVQPVHQLLLLLSQGLWCGGGGGGYNPCTDPASETLRCIAEPTSAAFVCHPPGSADNKRCF